MRNDLAYERLWCVLIGIFELAEATTDALPTLDEVLSDDWPKISLLAGLVMSLAGCEDYRSDRRPAYKPALKSRALAWLAALKALDSVMGHVGLVLAAHTFCPTYFQHLEKRLKRGIPEYNREFALLARLYLGPDAELPEMFQLGEVNGVDDKKKGHQV